MKENKKFQLLLPSSTSQRLFDIGASTLQTCPPSNKTFKQTLNNDVYFYSFTNHAQGDPGLFTCHCVKYMCISFQWLQDGVCACASVCMCTCLFLCNITLWINVVFLIDILFTNHVIATSHLNIYWIYVHAQRVIVSSGFSSQLSPILWWPLKLDRTKCAYK